VYFYLIYADTNSVHLANVDIAVRAMEDQLRAVKAHLNEELQAIPKAMVGINILCFVLDARLLQASGFSR
jgi:hypothetical protein